MSYVNQYFNWRIHINIQDPEFGMEGTSSGAMIANLITSLALNLPVPTDLIMKGEISLEGRVIEVGSQYSLHIKSNQTFKNQFEL